MGSWLLATRVSFPVTKRKKIEFCFSIQIHLHFLVQIREGEMILRFLEELILCLTFDVSIYVRAWTSL